MTTQRKEAPTHGADTQNAPHTPEYIISNRNFVNDVKTSLAQMTSTAQRSHFFPSSYHKNWLKKAFICDKIKLIMKNYYKSLGKKNHCPQAKEIAKFCESAPSNEKLFLHLMQAKKALESMKYNKEGSFHRRLMFCIDRVRREGNLEWDCAVNHKYIGQ